MSHQLYINPNRQYDNGYRGQRSNGARVHGGYQSNNGSRGGSGGGLRGGRGGGGGVGQNQKRNNPPVPPSTNSTNFQPWNGPPTNQFNNMKIAQ